MHINVLYKIRNSFMGVQWGRERQPEDFTNLHLISGTFPFLFNYDFSHKYKEEGRHLFPSTTTPPPPPPPPPPQPVDGGCLRIYCELNGRKH
jgi:hypothetical protein